MMAWNYVHPSPPFPFPSLNNYNHKRELNDPSHVLILVCARVRVSEKTVAGCPWLPTHLLPNVPITNPCPSLCSSSFQLALAPRESPHTSNDEMTPDLMGIITVFLPSNRR